MIESLFWLFLIIVAEAIALYSVKKYSVTDSYQYLIISIAFYAVIPVLLYKILKNNYGIGIVNVIWNIASILYGLFIGVIIFSEHITFQQKLGAILGLVGTSLILYDSEGV